MDDACISDGLPAEPAMVKFAKSAADKAEIIRIIQQSDELVVVDTDWTEVDVVVPLSGAKVRIGTAMVRYKNGQPEVGEMKIAGKGAPLLGVKLSLLSVSPPSTNPNVQSDSILFAENAGGEN
jgi:hypothetical protein